MNTSRKLTFRIAVAATGAVVSMAALAPTAMAAAPTALKSLSVTSGTTAGGETVTIFGTSLATAAATTVSASAPAGIPAPTVTFKVDGGSATAATNVRAFGSGVVQVTVPASTAGAAGKATVSIDPDGAGPAAAVESKAGAYTYNAAAPSVTNTAGVLAGAPTSELGGTGLTLTGSGLKDATVTVGGKKATVSASAAGSLTYDAPKDLAGYQPVVVKTKGGTVDAGVIKYTAAVPTITAVKNAAGAVVEKVSITRDNILSIEGTNLDAVTAAVLQDNALSNPVADQKLTIDKKASTPTKLVVKLAKNTKATAGIADGDIVLTTKYEESVPDNLSNLATYKAAAPTLASGLSLGVGGTTLKVTGTNLEDLVSIKFAGKAVVINADNVKNATATGFDLTVPAQTLKAPATTGTAALEVVTDGGKIVGSVALSAAPSIVSASVSGQTVTLKANAPLTEQATSAGLISLFEFKKGDVAKSPTSVAVAANGTITAVFADDTFAVGDVVSVKYTPGDSASKIKGSATGTPAVNAITTALTTTIAAPAPTYTSAGISGTTVTITGTNLATTNQVVFTPNSGAVVTKTGGDLTVNGGKTTITVTAPTTPGTYKVTLKATAGGAVVAPTTAQTITVAPAAAPTLSSLTADLASQKLTLVSSATLTAVPSPSDDVKAQFTWKKGLDTITPTSVVITTTGVEATFDEDTFADGDTVSATYTKSDTAGDNIKAANGTTAVASTTSAVSTTVEAEAPAATFTSVDRDPATGALTINGTNLADTVYVTLTAPDTTESHPSVTGSGTQLTIDGTAPTAPGSYTVSLKTSSGGSAIGTSKTFSITQGVLEAGAADAGDKTVILTGQNLENGSLTGAVAAQFTFKAKTNSDPARDIVPLTLVVSGGNTITATFDTGEFAADDEIVAVYAANGGNALTDSAGVAIAGFDNTDEPIVAVS